MDNDDIARLRAESDQAAAGLQEVARNLWAFFSELLEQGFTADQAMTFTQVFLVGMLGRTSEE
jgi:hypothetical protein